MPVELAHRFFGRRDLPNLVILHGLLGSSRNWQKIGEALAEEYAVWALDARNHGVSPHAATHTYADQVGDVLAFLDRHGLPRVHLLGHSMGGKTAMRLAVEAPRYLATLTVVDIAPRAHATRWGPELDALLALDLDSLRTRQEAEELLEPRVPDWALRKFLLTNLDRRREGGWRWLANLTVLRDALPDLFASSLADGARYEGPTLFMRGSRSNFLGEDDLPGIRASFPTAKLETVAEAGHNCHFDNAPEFLRLLRRFLADHPTA